MDVCVCCCMMYDDDDSFLSPSASTSSAAQDGNLVRNWILISDETFSLWNLSLDMTT